MQLRINKNLNRFALVGVLAISVFWTLSAGSAFGQSQGRAPGAATATPGQDNDINRRELTNFDKYLDDHPKVAQALKSNPSLINDPNWLAKHQRLQTFLQNHPGVQEEVKENPTKFINRERRFERNSGDISRPEAARFDKYLDSHPEVAEQLRKNPELIDNKEFVENHPELKEFLKNHPEAREDLKQHPRAFMKRERQFERHEGGEGRQHWRR